MANTLIFAAVPYSLGLTQPAGRIAIRSCADVSLRYPDVQPRQKEQISGRKKRMKLDHLTAQEKAYRRRLMNREAAQNARDEANRRMKMLEKKSEQLRRERDILLMENALLKENHKQLESENQKLLQVSVKSSTIKVPIKAKDTPSEDTFNATDICSAPLPLDNSRSERSVEQAWFINTPLLKGQDLQKFLLLMAMMTVTELVSFSFPYLNTEVLTKNMMLATFPCISKIMSGMIHAVTNSMYPSLSYHKSWT